MVGCIKYLAESKWKLDEFKNAFKSKKRSNCARPAPSCGLYLTKISFIAVTGVISAAMIILDIYLRQKLQWDHYKKLFHF